MLSLILNNSPAIMFLFDTEVLQARGYQCAPQKRYTSQACEQLKSTLEKIKDFWWDCFGMVGLDENHKVPPFPIHFQGEQIFYKPLPQNLLAQCFAFSLEEIACVFTLMTMLQLSKRRKLDVIDISIARLVGRAFQEDLTQADLGKVDAGRDVLNDAFYIAAKNLEKYDNASRRLLRIWVGAARYLDKNEATFQGFAQKTVQLTSSTHGTPLQEVIRDAWRQVGVTVE